MTKRLDRLNPSNSTGIAFQKLWQRNCESVEEALDSLIDAVAAIAAAQAAADAANTAAAAADTAAAAAQDTADSITAASEIGDSFVTGCTIGATDAGADATITISAHTRHYPQPDGTTVDVSVNGGSLTARAYSTLYYIYYDDAAHAGGAVTYNSTTSEATAAQLGDRHCVGAVTTPAALAVDTGGTHVGPPGPGQLSSL
jgi:hypothetical protein